jgi:hypothetical protein
MASKRGTFTPRVAYSGHEADHLDRVARGLERDQTLKRILDDLLHRYPDIATRVAEVVAERQTPTCPECGFEARNGLALNGHRRWCAQRATTAA